MYLFTPSTAMPTSSIDRAIEGLIPGLFLLGNHWIRKHRTTHAKFFESYADLCLSAAFPEGLPHVTGEAIRPQTLTMNRVRRAAEAAYGFRSKTTYATSGLQPEWYLGMIALECRWMLEGYLGFPSDPSRNALDWMVGLPSERREPRVSGSVSHEFLSQEMREAIREVSAREAAGANRTGSNP